MGSVFLIDELRRLGWQKRLAIVMATADPTHRMNFFSTSRSWGVRGVCAILLLSPSVGRVLLFASVSLDARLGEIN